MMEIKITKATEKRIKALRRKDSMSREGITGEQKFVVAVYDKMLCYIGCYGASLEELERWGIQIWADFEMHGIKCYVPEMNGLSVKYPDCIHYTDTHGMNYLTIKDFNKLVRLIA